VPPFSRVAVLAGTTNEKGTYHTSQTQYACGVEAGPENGISGLFGPQFYVWWMPFGLHLATNIFVVMV